MTSDGALNPPCGLQRVGRFAVMALMRISALALACALIGAASGCSSSGSTGAGGANTGGTSISGGTGGFATGGSGTGGTGTGGFGTGGSGTGGAGIGGTGGNCNCGKGGYFPVCGIDGTTYDAICGTECVPVAIACTGECPCDAGAAGTAGTGGATSTACGQYTCDSAQVCVTPGCGGSPLPDAGPCTPPMSCESLPTACGSAPSCACLEPLWSTTTCGSLKYGALECLRPCA